MKLNHIQFLVVNELSETVISYDDVNRLTAWLFGKKVTHLKVIVIGNSGRAQVLDIGTDVLGFSKTLVTTLNQLTH
jgi:hypothetical protein